MLKTHLSQLKCVYSNSKQYPIEKKIGFKKKKFFVGQREW